MGSFLRCIKYRTKKFPSALLFTAILSAVSWNHSTHVGGGSSSADGDSNETAPSTSLKRISDALGQAKKSSPAPSSLKMSLGVAKAPFPQSSSSLKISKLKSKISSKIQISSNRQAAAAAAKNTNDIEQESITFHTKRSEAHYLCHSATPTDVVLHMAN